MATQVYLVYCTFPEAAKAAEVAKVLVNANLAACVNIVPGLRSIYSWKGEVCDDAEVLALIKTTTERFDELRAKLVELHPYECPEVIAVNVADGFAGYLTWVADNTRPQATDS